MSCQEVDEVVESLQSLPLLLEAATQSQDEDVEEATEVYQMRNESMYNVTISGKVEKGVQMGVNYGSMNICNNDLYSVCYLLKNTA